MLGNGIDCQSVLAASPLLYSFEAPRTGESHTRKRQLIPEGAYAPDFLKDLETLGIKVEQIPRARVLAIKGTVALGFIDSKSHVRQSAEDPATLDFAEAY